MSKTKRIPIDVTREVRDACLCLHVQRAARALTRRFDEVFWPLDLTSGQFSLLMSANRPNPPNMTQVSAVLAMDRTTLTANLKPLQRRGLVQISVDPADKRSRRLVLTSAGHVVLSKAVPVWRRTHAAIERELAGGGVERLRADLRSLSVMAPVAAKAR